MRSIIGIAVAVMLTVWAGSAGATAPRREDALRAASAAGQIHLDNVMFRIGERQAADRGGLDLDRLALRFDGQEIPGGALAPVPEEDRGLAGRLGAFVSGFMHWIGGVLLTDGVTAGVDLDLDQHTTAGIAAGYVKDPEPDGGLTARTLAVYVARTDERGRGVHAIAGIGRATSPGRNGDWEEDGDAAADAGGRVLFGELGGFWRLDPDPSLTLTPELRLSARATRASEAGQGTAAGPEIDALARLTAEYRRDLGDLGWLRLGADVSWRLPLSDGGRRRRGGTEPRLRFGSRAAKSVLMLNASLERPEGTVITLDHVTEPRHRGPDEHRVRAGLTVRF